ncbi:hypothetical protein, partial [Sulfuricurvum sp.]|uniref:hypothetical protein n=1 Tax=Sulfuricurvum sp. TaxID=2025608 RepID=UPI0025EC1625
VSLVKYTKLTFVLFLKRKICTFLFSRKVPKEHTAIQERFAPLGTSAFGAALGIGLRDYFNCCPQSILKSGARSRSARVAPAICSKDDFLLILFL